VNRQTLIDDILDLFLSPEGRLSERQRSLMVRSLSQLIHEVEMSVRRELAKRLAEEEGIPRDLIVMLATDESEIAHPILHESGVLKDPDVVEIIKHCTQEQRLAIAMREPLNEEISQALVDTGDKDVIEALLNNHDAEISARAMAYLVSESHQVDRFRQPLLRRPDLPVELAHRMFWWVSAALREYILENFRVDETVLNGLIHETTTKMVKRESESERSSYEEAETVVVELAQRGQSDGKFLLRSLRRGRVAAFTVAVAKLADVDIALARRIIFDPRGEGLAVLCKASGMDRSTFLPIFLLTREAQDSSRLREKPVLDDALRIFDSLSRDEAAGALRRWQLNAEYLATTERIRSAQRRTRGGVMSGPKPSRGT
jgi:uncharacterized protein (DUF2336 family)